MSESIEQDLCCVEYALSLFPGHSAFPVAEQALARIRAALAAGTAARDEGPLGHIETVKRIARYLAEQAGDRSLANMVIDDEAAIAVERRSNLPGSKGGV